MKTTITKTSLLAFALLICSSSRAELTSEVRSYNGIPALFVNGKLTSQILAAPYRPGASNFTDFKKTGNRIYDVYFRFNWTGRKRMTSTASINCFPII
jgi:hypothetical protein